jgi:hypothetical protein
MWQCDDGCQTDEVLAASPDKNAGAILVNRKTGQATNRWWDGTAGVPELLSRLAEEDDHPMCPSCLGFCHWLK